MRKVIILISLMFMCAFKCGSSTDSAEKSVSAISPAKANEALRSKVGANLSADPALSNKVSGPLKVVITNGMYYGDIKKITADKVAFGYLDYGTEESEKDVEHSVQDGLLIDEAGEVGAPVIIYVEVPGGRFPCSSMISHNQDAKFCNHLVLETDEIFKTKLAKEPDFRVRFGNMIGKDFTADSKNPYFKVSDVP